jgi:hypothetical protein
LLRKTRWSIRADAEAIFWDIRIEDREQNGDISLALTHYIRVKIFTERGKEDFATVEIPRVGKRSILDVAARTIKPNGSIIDLKKDAIFDRQLAKTKGVKLRGKSFALPNVEVGDIVEYQYKEVRDNELAQYQRLYFQRDIPAWNITYHLKPLSSPYFPFTMRSMAFQCNHPPFQKEPNGFFATTMTNMPAFRREPYSPPEDQLRAWVLIYYEEDKKIDAEKYWKTVGRQDFASFKPLLNAVGLVKRTAAEIVDGIDKPEEKLTALDAFCRSKIRNLSSSAFQLTPEERKAIKENHSPADTLKQTAGRDMDVNFLFAALANAAGFDARMARIPSRGDTFFSVQRPTTYFIDSFSVAVKVGDNWSFYDPATPYLEPGMLRWQEEGQMALISDSKDGFFARTQFLKPDRSRREHRGFFKLLEDGTLEGMVQYTYTGHEARKRKLEYDDLSLDQQEKEWKESVMRRFPGAELSDFKISSVTDPLKPLAISHKVSIPGYATCTGRRILLQPAFFQRNYASLFPERERKFDLYFDYAWLEDDEVTIELPEGWELDQPVAPQNMNIGGVGAYSVEVRRTTDGRKLIYRRRFDWGRDMTILLPVAAYQQVKNAFDAIRNQDNYTITLKASAQ